MDCFFWSGFDRIVFYAQKFGVNGIMKKKIKNKKAELTTQQLVTLIILIVSFAVILILLFRLNLGEITDKEICHNSVVMKAQSKLKSGALDCRTNYVCISGGEKCDDFNPSITVDINMNQEEEKVKKDTMRAIANEMADCWWMFGEGKVDYIGLNVKGVTIGKMNCALCSIVDFDKEIEKIVGDKVSYEEFYENYLKSFEKDGKNYLSYMYGTNQVKDLGLPDEYIDFKNKYAIMTGIADKGYLTGTANWVFKSFDTFNNIFVSFAGLPKVADYKNHGPIPIMFVNKLEIDKLECDEFITKA